MRGRHRHRVACGFIVASAVWTGACASRSPAPPPASLGDTDRPAVEMGGLGLEVRGWVVDNRDHRLADRFAGLESAAALGEADDLWASCGMRVIEVAVDELPALAGALAVGPEQRLWLGQPARWTEAYGAAATSTRSVIQMPEGELVLEPGVLRLLARAWVQRRVEWNTPEIGQVTDAASLRTTLRVDLVPQNREREVTDLTLEPVDPTRPLDTGLVFERLRASWASDGTRALLLIPADPEEDWEALARSIGPVPDEVGAFGPAGPARATLGEALLGAPREGFRIVLVLIPRTSVER